MKVIRLKPETGEIAVSVSSIVAVKIDMCKYQEKPYYVSLYLSSKDVIPVGNHKLREDALRQYKEIVEAMEAEQ